MLLWQLLTPSQQAQAEEIEAEMKATREDRRSADDWMQQRRKRRQGERYAKHSR